MSKYFQENLFSLRKKFGKTQSDIGLAVNKGHNTIGNWEKGITEPNMSELSLLCKYFDISMDLLVNTDLSNVHLNKKDTEGNTGDNVHLNVHPSVHLNEKKGGKSTKLEVFGNSRMPQVITMDSTGNENVVFVPVKARAGYLNGYGDPKFISKLPAYRLPGLNNGTFRMFEVEGASMYPTINGGDVVIGSFVENLMDVRDDRLYVVVTKTDGMVIKRCLNRIQQDGKLILKSDNYKDRDLYPTMVVSPDDILEIWYAKSFISYQMRPPSEMYTRLIDVEGRLTLLEQLNKK